MNNTGHENIFQLVSDSIYEDRMAHLYNKDLRQRDDYNKIEKKMEDMIDTLPIARDRQINLSHVVGEYLSIVQDAAFKQGFKDGIKLMKEVERG